MTKVERFNVLYDLHAGNIHAWFTLCFDHSLADDLTQQTFLNLWKHLLRDDASLPENWKSWLFRAAINVKNDHLRNKYARPPAGPLPENLDAGPGDPASDPLERIAVDTAFRKLTLDEKEILLLRNMGFTGRESGSLLGISGSAARSRLQKARIRFRLLLEESGVTLDA